MGLELRDAGFVPSSAAQAAPDPAKRAFLSLPQRVYAGDPWYLATPPAEVEASLLRPEFAGRQRALVALDAGEPAARLVARLSPVLRDGAGKPLGALGFFEAVAGADQAVAALFAEGCAWLRSVGAGEIVGPMDGDTWHRYRLSCGPFDAPPFLLEPYNPPSYPALWQANGFEVVERYFSQKVEADAVVRACAQRAEEALAAGYRLRPLDLARFEDELRTLYRLSLAIFAGNYLYTPIEEERFLALYRGAKALLDPRLVWFAHAPASATTPAEDAGREVGFLFAYPDRVNALRAMGGRRDLLAKLRFLLRRGEWNAIDFKTLGVLAAHRRSGVAAALFHRGHVEALAMGCPLAYHCLFREGNPSGDLDGGAGTLLRRYELYRLASSAPSLPWSPPPGPLPSKLERGRKKELPSEIDGLSVLSPSPACWGGARGGDQKGGSELRGGDQGRDNVLSILRDVALRLPHRPALVLGRDSITFSQLWERIDRASVGLRRAGLAPGDRAIVMIPMSIDLYVTMLALLKIGAVAVFVDPWIGRRQIAAFAAFAEPRAFLGIGKSHLLRWLDPRLRRIPLTVTSGRRLGPVPALRTLRELEREPGDGVIAAVDPDASALITFTSGSSGEPKGANRTHRFLLAQGAALGSEFPALPGDVDMPMFPVFALNNLAAGVTSIVPAMDFRRVDEVDGTVILEQMLAHGVTTATASPPFFDRLAAALRPSRGRLPLPPLRRILTGGAPVSDGQLAAWREALPETRIEVVYGSTEAEPVAHIGAEERRTATNADRPAAPGYCAGRPSERVRCRIVRIERGPIRLEADGWSAWEMQRGAVGELVVSGDHVGRDYYRNPRAVAENKIVESDGTVWHRMGDTGSFDPEGRFWLAGRVHSTIRRGGELVHPQLVEQAARGGEERIVRAAALGLPDAALGERVVLVLETRGGTSIAEAARERVLAAGLKVDEVVTSTEPLPVDPRHNSKIDYERLRRRLSGQRERERP